MQIHTSLNGANSLSSSLAGENVRNFLAFLGITDIEFVYAEGTAMGVDMLAAAIAGARERINELDVRTA